MKIVITNTAVLNTGDAAILFGTLAILRRALGADLDVVVCDQQDDVAAQCYPDLDFEPILYDRIAACAGPRRSKAAALAVLAVALLWRTPLGTAAARLLPPSLRATFLKRTNADLVVSTGGTYFVPHYRLFPKIFELLVTIALGQPFVLFTQSLGPFPHHKRLLRFVLRRARLILVRDQRSRENLLRLGVPRGRIFECADAAFALSGTVACRQTEEPIPNRRLRVAVSVRNWPHFQGDSADAMDRYLDAVADTVTMLIERHDALVVFLSTCQGVGEYWTDDSAIAEKVIERLPPDLRKFMFVDCGFHTPNMLIEALGGYDLVIATRMHVAILAMCIGVPVLPIAYEFKTVELFTRLGLDEHVQHIESVSSPELCRAVENLLVSRLQLGKTLQLKIEEERRSAFAAGYYVAAALEGV